MKIRPHISPLAYFLAVLWLNPIVLTIDAYGAVSAWVDRHQVDENQNIELVLRSDKPGNPDFSVLQQDFSILSTRSSSEISSINGQVESRISWSLILKPKMTGTLTIPPISLNGETSKALSIQVKPLDQATRRAIDALVFFQTTASSKTIYIQAQLLYTRSLFYAQDVQLYGEMPPPPDIPDAIVLMLGDATTHNEYRNGRRYGVIEQRFAIFPEYSGELIVPAATINGSARLPFSVGGSGRRSQILVHSSPLKVQVLPVPKEYPANQPWFPATSVSLDEVWETAKTELTVGEPSRRDLMVRAESTVASMIPPLDVRYPSSIKSYPEPPSLDDFRTSEGVTGVRSESVSLVLTRSGTVTVPAVALTWWDTKNDRLRKSIIKARDFVVHHSTTQADVPAPKALTLPQAEPQPEAAPDRSAAPNPRGELAALPILYAALAVLLLGVWWLFEHKVSAADLVSGFKRDDKKPLNERFWYKSLVKAAKRGDAAAFLDALRHWLPLWYHTAYARALSDFRQNTSCGEDLDALLVAHYACEQNFPAENLAIEAMLRRLVAAIKQLRSHRGRHSSHPGDHLAQLYPTGSAVSSG